jgi:8-oxo-dGTP diphosphatase
MLEQLATTFVTVDMVIPRLSPTDSGWEVALIQRRKQPYQGAWALPGGHLNTTDTSLGAAAQRETREETGLDIPLHQFVQVHTYEDFEDTRGKYVCLLYVLKEPLSSEALIEAGDDASRVQWFPIENLQRLPFLAFNHITLLRTALRQFFVTYYHSAVGLQEINPCQCERESAVRVRCANIAYWRYNNIALCPGHMQVVVNGEREWGNGGPHGQTRSMSCADPDPLT